MSEHHRVSLVRAHELMRAGRNEEALGCARAAVEGQGRCTTAHGLLATILLNLGRTDEARAAIVAACTLPEGGADAWDALAFVSIRLGDHEGACELYRKAAQLAPGEAGVRARTVFRRMMRSGQLIGTFFHSLTISGCP